MLVGNCGNRRSCYSDVYIGSTSVGKNNLRANETLLVFIDVIWNHLESCHPVYQNITLVRNKNTSEKLIPDSSH